MSVFAPPRRLRAACAAALAAVLALGDPASGVADGAPDAPQATVLVVVGTGGGATAPEVRGAFASLSATEIRLAGRDEPIAVDGVRELRFAPDPVPGAAKPAATGVWLRVTLAGGESVRGAFVSGDADGIGSDPRTWRRCGSRSTRSDASRPRPPSGAPATSPRRRGRRSRSRTSPTRGRATRSRASSWARVRRA
jgi:hypothetical protein